MDKFEYNAKLEEINRLALQEEYEEAARIADSIEWKRVRNVRTLCMISEIYEANNQLDESKQILLRAYRRSPAGRNILYRLTEVAVKMREFDDAVEYYTEFVNAAPNDNSKYILKFKIYKGRGSSLEEQIGILEEFKHKEYTERWAYELAKLYHNAGDSQKCIEECDDITLWFRNGSYVVKALELKKQYMALTPEQQTIYDNPSDIVDLKTKEETVTRAVPKLEKEILKEMPKTEEEAIAANIIADTEREIAASVAIHQKENNAQKPNSKKIESIPVYPSYNTADLQNELAKNMREILTGIKKPSTEEGDIQSVQETMHQDEGANQADMHEMYYPEEKEAVADMGRRYSIDDVLTSMNVSEEDDTFEDSEQEAFGESEEDDYIWIEEDNEESEVNKDLEEDSLEEDSDYEEDYEVESKTGDHAKEEFEEDFDSEEELEGEYDSGEELEEEYDSGEELEEEYDLGEELEEEYDSEEELEDPYDSEEELEEAYNSEEEYDSQEELEAVSQGNLGDGAIVNNDSYSAVDLGATVDLSAAIEEAANTSYYFTQDNEEQILQENSRVKKLNQSSDPMYHPAPELNEHIRRNLSQPQMDTLGFFAEIKGLDYELAGALDQIMNLTLRDKTSSRGNIVISGDAGSGKSTLGVNLAKAVSQEKGESTAKIAKIYAEDFNKKDILATVSKIAGGTLIIEEAGDLDENAVGILSKAMEFKTDSLIVILEDEKRYVRDLLARYPDFSEKFNVNLAIPILTNDELVEFGKAYATNKDYRMDELAIQVLYERIGAIQTPNHPVNIGDVKDILDKAIKHVERFGPRKLFSSLSGKRYDDDDRVILYEKDFR